MERLQLRSRGQRQIVGEMPFAYLELANGVPTATEVEVAKHQLVVHVFPVTLTDRERAQYVDRLFVPALAQADPTDAVKGRQIIAEQAFPLFHGPVVVQILDAEIAAIERYRPIVDGFGRVFVTRPVEVVRSLDRGPELPRFVDHPSGLADQVSARFEHHVVL